MRKKIFVIFSIFIFIVVVLLLGANWYIGRKFDKKIHTDKEISPLVQPPISPVQPSTTMIRAVSQGTKISYVYNGVTSKITLIKDDPYEILSIVVDSIANNKAQLVIQLGKPTYSLFVRQITDQKPSGSQMEARDLEKQLRVGEQIEIEIGSPVDNDFMKTFPRLVEKYDQKIKNVEQVEPLLVPYPFVLSVNLY